MRTNRIALLALWLLFAGNGAALRAESRPTITVEATYPEASADVVADTVAAPIEQQLRGIEKAAYFWSQSAPDGTYTLDILFEAGVDLNRAQALVQERVNLAVPILPDVVKHRGVTVKKKSPGLVLLIGLSSPDHRYDTFHLGNYATIQIRDELLRLPGVQEVRSLGHSNHGLRVWLDPDKLAARNLAASDIIKSLEPYNKRAARKAKEGLAILGQLADVQKLSEMIVKTDAAGQVIYLRDVAQVELGATQGDHFARLNDMPVVLLAVYPTPTARPREVRRALTESLAGLRARLPEGLHLDVPFDFTPSLEAGRKRTGSEYLLVQTLLPAAASMERVLQAQRDCQKALRSFPEVRDTLLLSEDPFARRANGPCILVRLARAEQGRRNRDQLVSRIRRLLQRSEAMLTRIRDLSGPGSSSATGYPLDLALHGPDRTVVTLFSEKFVARLQQSNRLTDVGTSPRVRLVPGFRFEIDQAKAKAVSVKPADIATMLRLFRHSTPGNDFHSADPSGQIQVQTASMGRMSVEDFKLLKVRNTDGQMIPLGVLVSVREVNAPLVLERLNGQPMAEVSANPAADISLEEARLLCTRLAEEVRKELRLPAAYRLTWLQESRVRN